MAVTSGRERTTPRRGGGVILVTVFLPASAQPGNSAMVPAIRSAVRADPDIALVHELNLPVDYFPAIFVVGIRGRVEVDVLRVDRLLVNKLVLLGGEVLDPVVPLRIRAEPAERLDVDGTGDPGGHAAVVVPPDDLAAVVDHDRPAAEG